MDFRKPPAIAAWLIARNSPLAGDLLEEFQRGKSRAWFWRQALMAFAADRGHNVRVSQLYLKAFFIGFAAQAVVAFILWRFRLLVFGLVAAFLSMTADFVLRHKIAGSFGASLWVALAECGETELRKRTAISRLVALHAFALYLFCTCATPGSLPWNVVLYSGCFLNFLVDVVLVVFVEITPASAKRP